MALPTDSRILSTPPKHTDAVSTQQNFEHSAFLSQAAWKELGNSGLASGDTALAGLLGAKPTISPIQGNDFVIPPAPYPETNYSETAKAAADEVLAKV
jgi:hypothetical protein